MTLDADFEITDLMRERYGKLFHKKGEKFYHITPPVNLEKAVKGTDMYALNNNKVSITPLNLDLTSKNSKDKLFHVLKNEW